MIPISLVDWEEPENGEKVFYLFSSYSPFHSGYSSAKLFFLFLFVHPFLLYTHRIIQSSSLLFCNNTAYYHFDEMIWQMAKILFLLWWHREYPTRPTTLTSTFFAHTFKLLCFLCSIDNTHFLRISCFHRFFS